MHTVWGANSIQLPCASDAPVPFVQTGTHFGRFIPSLLNYIEAGSHEGTTDELDILPSILPGLILPNDAK